MQDSRRRSIVYAKITNIRNKSKIFKKENNVHIHFTCMQTLCHNNKNNEKKPNDY